MNTINGTVQRIPISQLEMQKRTIEKQIEARQEEDKRVDKLRGLIKTHGFTQDDCAIAFGATKKPARAAKKGAKKGGTLPPKFFHPTDKTLSWSGKARKPGWVVAYLKEHKGAKLEDLAKRP